MSPSCSPKTTASTEHLNPQRASGLAAAGAREPPGECGSRRSAWTCFGGGSERSCTRRSTRSPQAESRSWANDEPAAKGQSSRYKNRWAAQIEVQEWNQPRRRKTVYGATQAEVLTKLDELRDKIQHGIAIPAGRAQTTGAYLELWLTETLPADVLAGRLKASTLASYTDQTRRHILPALGHIPLDQLSPRQIRSWLTGKLAETSYRGTPLSARDRRLPTWHSA